MKGSEKYIYIAIIIILVGVIASGATYIIMKDNNKTVIKNNQNNEDKEIENKPNVDNNEENQNKEEISDKYIIGKDNKKYYLKSNEEETELIIYNSNSDKISTEMELYNCFDTVKHEGFLYSYDFGYVELEDNFIWYNNTLNINTDDIFHDVTYKTPISVKVENNKIYFLMPILNLIEYEGAEGTEFMIDSENPGILEEREYTINNNKLEYKVIKTYKIKNVSQTC